MLPHALATIITHHHIVAAPLAPYACQVYSLYAVLFLSALNRLPIKLPAKGTGRKHRGGGGTRSGGIGGEGARRGSGSNTVLFADVAGVDEAKEELQEIVVSWFDQDVA